MHPIYNPTVDAPKHSDEYLISDISLNPTGISLPAISEFAKLTALYQLLIRHYTLGRKRMNPTHSIQRHKSLSHELRSE